MRSHTRPKCQSSMVEGFVPQDQSGTKAVSGCAEGAPNKRWYGVKVTGKPIEIATWRCTRCGFLEQYARN